MKKALFVLRLGVGLTFLYPGIAAFLEPYNWIGFIPPFLRGEGFLVLHLFSAFEIVLALFLFFNIFPKISALLSAGVLGLIIVFNFSQLDIVFRDIPILFAAIALYFLSEKEQ